MSIEAMSWALKVPVGGNQKVVLMGVANHAHPDGTEAYPSLDTLAEYAACDRSTARRNARKLVANGWLIEDGEGPKGTTKYTVPIWLLVGVAKRHPGVASEHGGGGTSASGGVAPMPPEPSIEPSSSQTASENNQDAGEELSLTLLDASESPDLVAVVWEHYRGHKPRQSVKVDATSETVIRNALKVASAEECCAAIDGCFASAFHQGDNDRGVKYNALGQILKGRPRHGESTRDRIDFFVDLKTAKPSKTAGGRTIIEAERNFDRSHWKIGKKT